MKTILHVHNVAWLGGVPAFIAEFPKAFPQFHHISLYLSEGEDKGALQMLNDAGVRTLYTEPPLGPVVISQLDPDIVIWHNIPGDKLVGPSPWDWTKRWPSIAWHHSATRPTVKADVHLFVSYHLKKAYQGLVDSKYITSWDVIPPCIDASKFRWDWPEEPVIGKIATPTNAAKYPFLLLEVAEATHHKLLMPGANQYFGERPDVIDVTPSWFGVAGFLKRCSVFLYVNDPAMAPETWCRCVTEAMAAGMPVIAENRGGILEQVVDGENGILVNPNDTQGMIAAVMSTANRPLWDRRRAAAKARVLKIASLLTLQEKLTPHLMRALTGGP